MPLASPAEAKGCSTLEEQRTVYAKYTGRVDAIAGFLNFTKRLWCPLIAVPASQVSVCDASCAEVCGSKRPRTLTLLSYAIAHIAHR